MHIEEKTDSNYSLDVQLPFHSSACLALPLCYYTVNKNLPIADEMSNSQESLLILHPKYFSLELHVRDLPPITRLHCLGACPPKVTHGVLAGLKWISHLLPNSLQICNIDCKP